MSQLEKKWVHSPFEDLFPNAVFFLQKTCLKDTDENIYSCQTIINCVFALEASANCCLDFIRANKSQMIKTVDDKFDPLSKFEFYLSQKHPHKIFDRGVNAIQKIVELVALRNGYVHPKPTKLEGDFIDSQDENITRVYQLKQGKVTSFLKIPNLSSDWTNEHALLAVKSLIEFYYHFFIELCEFSLDYASSILCIKNYLSDGSVHWIISNKLKKAFKYLSDNNLQTKPFMKVPEGECDILLIEENHL